MPRVDNSDPTVIEVFGLSYDESDPGATEPVDLCWLCCVNEGWEDRLIDHPPYENGCDFSGLLPYTCKICGDELTEDDNG